MSHRTDGGFWIRVAELRWRVWAPAFAGVTSNLSSSGCLHTNVIPARAGIQTPIQKRRWFAGFTPPGA